MNYKEGKCLLLPTLLFVLLFFDFFGDQLAFILSSTLIHRVKMPQYPPKPHSTNKVEQQTLRHVYSHYSPISVAITLIIIATAFVPVGVLVLVIGDRATMLRFRYDNISKYSYTIGDAGEHAVDFSFNGSTYSSGVKTRVSFSLSKSIAAPIYIEYHLNPFYQNYRWFGASLDRSQLRGGTAEVSEYCEPFRFPGEYTGNRGPGYYTPCGALAWTLFNDSISLYKKDSTLICDGGAFTIEGDTLNADNKCKKKGIALSRDVKKSFKAPSEKTSNSGPAWKAGGDSAAEDPYLKEGYYYGEPGHKIPSSLDEDLMIWMNIALMPEFANTYRIIVEDLAAGDYYFDITEQFATWPYSSEKYVQLSTRTWVGIKSDVLGILLITLGSFSFVVALSLIVLACCLGQQCG